MGEHDPFFDDAAEDFDGPRTTSDGLVTCRSKTHCESDEACSQGGYCVNITGERDATQAIQRDLNELRAAVGVGTPYTLPPNSILLLTTSTDTASPWKSTSRSSSTAPALCCELKTTRSESGSLRRPIGP